MKYVIKPCCFESIMSFYSNVAKKYKHTYSKALMQKNIAEAYDAMRLIEKTLLRRQPTLEQWEKEGWHMTNAGKWYYAYTVCDDTVIIQDACHAQNMHDNTNRNKLL